MQRHSSKQISWGVVPALVALTLSLSAAVLAGPLDDAQDAYKRGDYPAARQYAEAAVRSDANNPRAYVALGTILRKQGDMAGAKAAWDNVFRLDPQLRTVSADAKFLNAYRAVGGTPPATGKSNDPANSVGGDSDANAILSTLASGSVYVHPDLAGEVDVARIEVATRAIAPTVVKVVVVPKIGRYPSRAALADDLRKQLNLGEDGAVIVATPKGISGVSGRLSSAQADQAFDKAGVKTAFASGGLREAVPTAVQAFGGSVTSDRQGDASRSGWIGVGLLGLIGGGIGFVALKRKRELDAARQPVEETRQEVLKNLSYVDGYLDLLPAGAEAERAKQLRSQAYAKYSAATQALRQSNRAEQIRAVYPVFQEALTELKECRASIDRATGGTGVAMAIPEIPDLSTEATRAQRFRRLEELHSKSDADRLQAEIESIPQNERGVSFFSGQPLPRSALVPVSIVIVGQKRSVMATREEAAQIMRGETPAVRAFDDGRGQYIPWYEYQGYDPYRNYYGGYGVGGGMGTFVDLMLFSYLFNGGGFFGGYGGWGGWGYGPGYSGWGGGYDGPVIQEGNPGYGGGGFGGGDGAGQFDATPDHSGGFDFFGQGGYGEQSADGGFGSDAGGGFADSGADFGGGGGGDFGGGDFGGGGDF